MIRAIATTFVAVLASYVGLLTVAFTQEPALALLSGAAMVAIVGFMGGLAIDRLVEE